MPHGITQCYLPPGRGDIPALNTAEADTRLSDPGEMQGCVDLKAGGFDSWPLRFQVFARSSWLFPFQVVYKHVPLLPSSIVCYRLNGSDVLRLGG